MKIFIAIFVILLINVEIKCQESECFSQLEFESVYNESLKNYLLLEKSLLESVHSGQFGIDSKKSFYNHFKSSKIKDEAFQHDRFATVCNLALKELRKNKNYSRKMFQNCSANIVTSKYCTPMKATCNASETIYYKTDGQCNNQQNPLWGSKLMPFVRLVSDSFSDGVDTPMEERLTNPREDAEIGDKEKGGFVEEREELINNDFSVILWQILTHELMHTKKHQFSTEEGNAGFDCCKSNRSDFHEFLIKNNPQCVPIKIDKSDACFGRKINCMHYSKPIQSFHQCQLNQTSAPMNFHTSIFDFELLFNDLSLNHLKENGGFFDTKSDVKMKELFVGYDERSGQLPGLFLFILSFAEFHNIVARQLIEQRPTLSQAQLILEARKATTGVYQRMMVSAVKSVLFDFRDPPLNCYDPNINPQVSVEFTIALRFFHFFIRDKWGIYSADLFKKENGLRGTQMEDIDMRYMMDNWKLGYENRCGVMHGLLDSSWNVHGLGPINRCSFFARNENESGIDLRAYDYAYASLVGEPSLCEVMKFFNKSITDCEKAISSIMDEGMMKKLAARYGGVENIGLSMGLDVEKKPEAIGLISKRIIAEQIRRSLCGDRFYYRHSTNTLFTRAQKIIIANFDPFSFICVINNCNITRLPDNPLFSPGVQNPKFPCNPVRNSFNTAKWFD